MRSLTAYQVAPGDAEGTTLVPDMATDTGTAARRQDLAVHPARRHEVGGRQPRHCADVAYGVSRQFDIGLTEGGPVYAVSYLDIPTDDEGNSPTPARRRHRAGALRCCRLLRRATSPSPQPVRAGLQLRRDAGLQCRPRGYGCRRGVRRQADVQRPYKISEYSKGKAATRPRP